MTWFGRQQPETDEPHWGGFHDRGRVLVEASDGAMRWAAEGILRKAGYDVRSCAGPDGYPDTRCPLAAGDDCALADGADVVLNQLGVRHAADREVVAALKRRGGDTPVIVEASAGDEEQHSALLDGTMVVRPSPTATRMRAEVAEAFEGLWPRPAE